MIRKIFVNCFALIAVAICTNAQNPTSSVRFPVNEETKLITYEKVVTVEETKRDEIFERAVLWANTFYKNPTDVIREKNPEAGKIVCKARFKISNPPDKEGFATDAGVVQYTLTILFKDFKYKYEITEINWKQLSYYPIERWMDSTSPSYNKSYAHYLQFTDEKVKEILADLEKNLANKPKKEKKDW